jgi:enoyl-CoA hydratase/carnithine racemase
MEMLLSGRFVSAEEAQRFGLVNRVVEPDELAKETRDWALELAQHSRFTLAFGKRAFYNQVDLDEISAYNSAVNAIAMNCLDEDAQEGMKAFLEKREPKWKKR